MTFQRRRLGSTDLSITSVGLGAWAIGGAGWAYGWGAQDDAASIATIVAGVRRGLNWIDTAAIYGLGHSEEIVGRALRELSPSERPLVFTKCGLEHDAQHPDRDPIRTLKPASIRRELEDSLRRLGVDQIDLYQFHWPDDSTAVEDSWGEMGRLLDEGKVRAAGVSNFDVELLERAEAIRHVDCLQPPFSLIRRDSGADVIPWAAAHATGVIVYSPLQSGILTASFSAERARSLAADDWRRRSSNFQEPALTRNIALRDRLVPIAERHGTSVSAVAIAWTTQFPGVTGAIVGARSPEQLNDWIDAGALQLLPEDLSEIG
jgi:aryl-alcohol dehydrogenase-like predicted oxidoreductase